MKIFTINEKIADPKKPNHFQEILLKFFLLIRSFHLIYPRNIKKGPIIGTKSKLLARSFLKKLYFLEIFIKEGRKYLIVD
jgi:hypothetical protein